MNSEIRVWVCPASLGRAFTFLHRFIAEVMVLFASHRITEVKHMRSVDRKHLTFPQETPAALTGYAFEALRRLAFDVSQR